jgi:uncharacterized protein involved in exopolysaccharide biosynthesis
VTITAEKTRLADIGAPSVSSQETGPTLRSIIRLLVAHRRVVSWVPLLVATLTITSVLLSYRVYTSRITFAPAGGSITAGSAIGGLAAQFGVRLAGEGALNSPDFYADLIRSKEFLRRLAESRYRIATGGVLQEHTLVDLARHGALEHNRVLRAIRGAVAQDTGPVANKELAALIETLARDILRVDPHLGTGTVTVDARTTSPELSAQLAQRVLHEIDAFNLRSRQAQAAAEKTFLEDRERIARADLRQAEDELERFLRANREFRSDPQLVLQHDRLQRDIALRQSVFTTVVENLERARIEAVRNTPSIAVVEDGMQALRPDRRHLLLKLLTSLVLGFVFAVGIVAARAVLIREIAADGVDVNERKLLPALKVWFRGGRITDQGR